MRGWLGFPLEFIHPQYILPVFTNQVGSDMSATFCFILKVLQHNIRRCRQRPLGTPCQSVGVDMSVSLGQLIAGRKAASPARLA